MINCSAVVSHLTEKDIIQKQDISSHPLGEFSIKNSPKDGRNESKTVLNFKQKQSI